MALGEDGVLSLDDGMQSKFVVSDELNQILSHVDDKVYNTTIDFKLDVIQELLSVFPSLKHVEVFDDRQTHVKFFHDALEKWKIAQRIATFQTHLVSVDDCLMPTELERELVLDLVKTHNDRIYACMADPKVSQQMTMLSIEASPSIDEVSATVPRRKTISNYRKPIELIDHVEYTAIFLESASKELLQSTFKTPDGWKIKSDHMTVSFGSANEEMIEKLGGLESTHTMIATHIGNYNDLCIALKLDTSTGLVSENETPHITLHVSQAGNARLSNQITEWTFLDAPIELKGKLNVKKVTGIKEEPVKPIEKQQVSLGELVLKHHPHLKGKEIGSAVEKVKDWMAKQFVVNEDGNRANIEYFIENLKLS